MDADWVDSPLWDAGRCLTENIYGPDVMECLHETNGGVQVCLYIYIYIYIYAYAYSMGLTGNRQHQHRNHPRREPWRNQHEPLLLLPHLQLLLPPQTRRKELDWACRLALDGCMPLYWGFTFVCNSVGLLF